MAKLQRSSRIIQAGAIPFRRREKDGRVEICLITNRSGRWGYPKGNIGKRTTPPEAALNEVYEEAGLRGGIVGDCFGVYRYQKNKQRYLVRMYLMHVEQANTEWPEADSRERRWVTIAGAHRLIKRATLREVLFLASNHMRQLNKGLRSSRVESNR